MLLIAALAACAPRTPEVAVSAPSCATIEISGELQPGVCQMDVSGRTLLVNFAPIAAGADNGNVSIDVLGDDGGVTQTMLESDVSIYQAPTIQDIDGDGRADILVPRAVGNVNLVSGVWIFDGRRGVFERVGEVTGVSVERTVDGYVAAPARSSAGAGNVAFYWLDADGLHPLLTLAIEAPAGRSTEPLCNIIGAPGLAQPDISETEARTKFCAEPAAQVFTP
jgi:hypothetical protein